MFKTGVRLATLEFWVSASQKTYTVLSTFYILHNSTSTLIYYLICAKHFKYKLTPLVLMETILRRNLCIPKLTTAISLVPHVFQKLAVTHKKWSPFLFTLNLCKHLWLPLLMEYDRRDMAWLPRIQLPLGFFSLRMLVLESSYCAVKSPRPHGEIIYNCSNQQHPAKILADSQHQPPMMQVKVPSCDSSL